MTEQVDEADGDAAVDVEDESVLLARGDILDGEGVVERIVAGEVLGDVVLDQLDAQIRVGLALDPVRGQNRAQQ